MSEGCKAFDDLHELTDKLVDCGLETNAIQNLQRKLKAGRNYRKIDFRVSICFYYCFYTSLLMGDLIVFVLVSALYRFYFPAAKVTILIVKQL